MSMERIQLILQHQLFSDSIKMICSFEKERIYCRHGIPHALDVCRIAMQLNVEQNLNISKPIVYAAGLLHDIGRGQQYQKGIPHEIASEKIARVILQACEFGTDIELICNAILHHRFVSTNDDLSYIIRLSDKLARSCWDCEAISTCKNNVKNRTMTLEY